MRVRRVAPGIAVAARRQSASTARPVAADPGPAAAVTSGDEGVYMFPSPARMFLTKGVGIHRHALTAFEFALTRCGYRAAEPSLCVVHPPPALRSYRPRNGDRVARAWGHHFLRVGPVRDQ